MNKIAIILRNPVVKRFLKGLVATVGAAAITAGGSYVSAEVPNLFAELGWSNVLKIAVVVAGLLGAEKAVPKNW